MEESAASKILKWCSRMEPLTNVNSFDCHRSAVLSHCPRGKLYFCDGRVNVSLKEAHNLKPIGICEHYENNRCQLKKINYNGLYEG